jgi:lantibiotic modifying enzyme
MKITLSNLSEATEQQVFDQVKNHMLTQMKKSVLESNGDICAYRGFGGIQCAAGCLMSDEEASKIPEQKSWYALSIKELVPKNHFELISELQDIHDVENPHEWAESLEYLASYRGLTF